MNAARRTDGRNSRSAPRTGIVVASRSGSSRLPGKALLPLRGQSMLLFLLRRIRAVRRADAVLLATTTLPADDALADLARQVDVPVVRGPVDDVVARYVLAAEKAGLDYVVRVTADCPFLDARLLDHCLEHAWNRDFHLATTKGVFPVGLDCEIYPAALMARLHSEGRLDAAEREHLTLRFYNRPEDYEILRIPAPRAWQSSAVLTVDTGEDYARAARLAEELPSAEADTETVLRAYARLFGEEDAH